MVMQQPWLRISPERMNIVLNDIRYGSQPGARFYALVATSVLIASFGLISNSTAVIIGAMLVAPLMTPIFGIALSLVLGDAHLLGRSIRAEIMGVILAVSIAALFGFMPLAVEVTPEMLSRTQPNLLDLLVAVLAGFAGSYAMIDEHLSPSLPGVAIATAIVPPLANSGLCLALGAYHGAYGSFLLFMANFLSILLVASATFIAAGLAPTFQWTVSWDFVRRFGLAVAGFALVAGILTHTLIGIVRERRLISTIKGIISGEFSQLPTTSLVTMIHQESQGKLYVLATVRTPKVINPNKVKVIQQALSKRLELPTELIVRSILAKDVSATGSTSQVTAENLDGMFLTGKLAPDVFRVQVAEQALRELLFLRPQLDLIDVDLLNFPRGPVILATIQSPRLLIPSEIKGLEEAVQKRLQDPSIPLLIRFLTTVDMDRHGRILYGVSHFGALSPEEMKTMREIDAAVKEEMKRFSNIFATNVDAAPKEDFWGVRVEVVGARVMSPRDVASLERAVSRQVNQKLKIFIWSRAEAMVTPDGYSSLEEYTRKRLEEKKEEKERGAGKTTLLFPAP